MATVILMDTNTLSTTSSLEEIGANLSVVVPCFNEAKSLELILRKVRNELPCSEIVVVDDGSTDGCGEISEGLRRSLQLVVIHQENAGKGAAISAGLHRVTRDWVVIQDADLEYEPSDILTMLQVLIDHPQVQAVYGTRYGSKGRADGGAIFNYWGVRLFSSLLRIRFGVRVSDPHTCYKLIRTDLLREFDLSLKGFEFCTEVTCKLLRRGVSIVEVPIRYTPRNVAQGKKIGWRDFITTGLAYMRFCFR